jgi:hypothetical protein
LYRTYYKNFTGLAVPIRDLAEERALEMKKAADDIFEHLGFYE